ncbi:phosphodiester glycosidase family protein [Paenibacillus chartarius]|uniref:Phosphodiester glycosidase family protein n=1 Tax=Paenibacillus chartarius TaxID=747481 RepID=A0ABV6DRR0_9BACL
MRVKRAGKRRAQGWQAVWVAAAFAFGCAIPVVGLRPYWDVHAAAPERDETYVKVVSSGGIAMNVIRSTPDRIELKKIATNVTETGMNGINGGFFYNGDLISIAVRGDQPLKGAPGDYGSGWYNVDTKKGTLVWDEAARKLSVQSVLSADEIVVASRSRYWAQGGVSMTLQDDGQWERIALEELMPAFDQKRLRSAVAYDRDQNLWLIVSDTPCTVPEFRAAIKEKVGRGRLVDGIFLDGDGSSQMKYGPVLVKGDSRPVYQMLAVKE